MENENEDYKVQVAELRSELDALKKKLLHGSREAKRSTRFYLQAENSTLKGENKSMLSGVKLALDKIKLYKQITEDCRKCNKATKQRLGDN